MDETKMYEVIGLGWKRLERVFTFNWIIIFHQSVPSIHVMFTLPASTPCLPSSPSTTASPHPVPAKPPTLTDETRQRLLKTWRELKII